MFRTALKKAKKIRTKNYFVPLSNSIAISISISFSLLFLFLFYLFLSFSLSAAIVCERLRPLTTAEKGQNGGEKGMGIIFFVFKRTFVLWPDFSPLFYPEGAHLNSKEKVFIFAGGHNTPTTPTLWLIP